MWRISSNTIRKSSPLGDPLLNAPGTFSQQNQRGRISIPVRPRSRSAVLISFTIRICSIKRPEREPDNPALVPATLRSWQGLPPQMRSTGNNSFPDNFVISPSCDILGNLCLVTFIGNGSISLAQSGMNPARTAARGKPPMPSNRLPMVIALISSPPPQSSGWYVPQPERYRPHS